MTQTGGTALGKFLIGWNPGAGSRASPSVTRIRTERSSHTKGNVERTRYVAGNEVSTQPEQRGMSKSRRTTTIVAGRTRKPESTHNASVPRTLNPRELLEATKASSPHLLEGCDVEGCGLGPPTPHHRKQPLTIRWESTDQVRTSSPRPPPLVARALQPSHGRAPKQPTLPRAAKRFFGPLAKPAPFH